MRYIKSFLQFARWKAVFSLGLGILLGLTEGVGLFMLIPLMEIVGIGGHSDKGEGVAAFIGQVMGTFGVPLTLFSVLCVYVALIALQSFASRLSQVINAELVSGYTCFLQNRIYAVLAYADWLSFLRLRVADIAHVLAVEARRVGIVTQQLLQLVGLVVLSLVYVVVALTISVPMTMAALACGLVLVLILRPFDQRAGHTGKAVQAHLKNQFHEMSEHLAGMKIAKSYGMERRHIRHFTSVTEQIAQQQISFSRINSKTKMYYQIGSAVALSGFFYGAVTLTHIDAAGMLLVVFLFARLLPRFSRIQLNLQQIHFNLPAFSAAEKMHRHLLEIREPGFSGPCPAVAFRREIRFDGVSFGYDPESAQRALMDVRFSVPADRMTAIVGHSGSGKSTLADLLLGLLSPTEGSITIDGAPLAGDRLAGWRQMVGYVPQDTFLFNDTIRANLLWACPEASEEAMGEALGLASAEEFVATLPRGLDTVLGDRGVRLSGGERQRIALARALLRKPALLLLDEATSSLDAVNEKRIQDAIAGLHGKLTLVVIAHRLTTIREADAIVVLDEGRVVERGDWNTLAASDAGHFRSMLRTAADFPRSSARPSPAVG
jgi:ATP-binding cassette subfamily C protein